MTGQLVINIVIILLKKLETILLQKSCRHELFSGKKNSSIDINMSSPLFIVLRIGNFNGGKKKTNVN